MRTVLMTAAALAGAGASAGSVQAAQRMVMPGPGVASPAMDGGPMASDPDGRQGDYHQMGTYPTAMRQGPDGQYRGDHHWGGQYQGHWVGGMRAPGGWSAYRKPVRGYHLPGYWSSADFRIGDWSDYGLYQPPVGYGWSRYYDDAVLVDSRGSVYDMVGGIDWRRHDLDEPRGERYAFNTNADPYRGTAGAGYPYPPRGGYAAQGGYAQPGYAQPGGYPQQGSYYPQQRSSGVGGALIGGAAGGVAGGLIAGRHDKVAGALIGAGAGALAGYAIDRSRRRDYPAANGAGADYPMPDQGYDRGPEYGRYGRGAPPTVIESGGGTVVTTSSVGGVAGGTYVNGYFYPPATVTTVTIASAPVVTTTTEVFEDTVTYTRRPIRHVYRKHVWHRPVCYCRAR